MPRGSYRLVGAALMVLVAHVEWATAKDKGEGPSRRPSSLSALSANSAQARTRDHRRIGNRRLPSGGTTEALLSNDSTAMSHQSSGELSAPRITLPRDRSMPRQGTLSPQYNYTDINIQFR